MGSDRGTEASGATSRDPTFLLGGTIATFFAASSAPTPLYRLYRDSFDLSPVLVTVIFAVYALALLGVLLIGGSLSDHVGRKPVIVGALLIEIAAMALFLEADGLPWLIAARAVQGVATGLAAASIGAALVDVDRPRGQFINAMAPLVGMAVGAVGTSALVQYGPFPLHFVYGLLLAAFVIQLVATWLARETGGTRPGALASLRPRISVPARARTTLAVITPINVATWMLGGFYLSLMPSLVVAATGDGAPLTGGMVVSGLMLAGAVAVAMRRQKAADANLTLGVATLVVGLATTVAGAHAASVPALILGTLIGGAGFGTSFLGTVGAIMPLATADERAELLSAFYIQSYLAFSIPAILAGYLTARLGYLPTIDLYAAAIAAMSLFGLLALRSQGRKLAATPT